MCKKAIFLLLFTINFSLWSQNVPTKRSVFIEIGGNGGLGSINYESPFLLKDNCALTWRAGLSFAPIDKNNGTAIVFPLMVNSIIGSNAHKLELGVGQGLSITTKGSAYILGTALIGYRYQPKNKNIFYRIGYTPLISYLVDFQWQNWAGISIGYSFKPKSK